MSKNITIAEGTQAKNFNNVHKLRTNVIGGGTQYWVPEDEAGDYAKLSEKTITSNGTYNASDENKDGYSKITVNVEKDVRLITKMIDENGTYNAKTDDGVDGYSQVSVDGIGTVRGLAQEGDQIGGNRLQAGEEYTIVKDSNGNLKAKLQPTSISITTDPSQLTYDDRENISFDGGVVKAYTESGVLWTDDDYPTGEIPHNELVLNPLIARYSYAYAKKYDSFTYDTAGIEQAIIDAMPFDYINATNLTYRGNYNSGIKDGSDKAIWDLDSGDYVYVIVTCMDGRNITPYAFSKKDFNFISKSWNQYGSYSSNREADYSSFKGEDIYWCQVRGTGNIGDVAYNTAINYSEQVLDIYEIFYVCLYGITAMYRDVNVAWRRPEDGKILRDSYTIKVREP